MDCLEPNGTDAHRHSLTLLGGFSMCTDAVPQRIGFSGQRVIALLALEERGWTRESVAERLWPDHAHARAQANLRSALWRLPQQTRRSLESPLGDDVLVLSGVAVDLRQLVSSVKALLESPEADPSPSIAGLSVACLTQDLLPGWDEEWLIVTRERLRYLRLHALERLCAHHSAGGRYFEAVEAGLAAVQLEPLRETAHRCLIRAHLAAGNTSEALRQYGSITTLLRDELGICPSSATTDLVSAARIGPQTLA